MTKRVRQDNSRWDGRRRRWEVLWLCFLFYFVALFCPPDCLPFTSVCLHHFCTTACLWLMFVTCLFFALSQGKTRHTDCAFLSVRFPLLVRRCSEQSLCFWPVSQPANSVTSATQDLLLHFRCCRVTNVPKNLEVRFVGTSQDFAAYAHRKT